MSKARWWVVFLLFAGTFINAIDRASLSIAAPKMMTDLGIDAQLMGVALSAFFWFYMVMNIPAGGLADRYGAKRTLGWAAGVWSVCSALTGSATHFAHVLLARVGVGVGEAASFPVNARIVTNSFPVEARGMVVGCYTSGLRLGFAVTPVLMAWLMSRWSWRVAFYATGLGSLLWVVLWGVSYREIKAEPDAGADAGIPWRELLRNRTVVGLVWCKFFQDYLFYLFVTWLPGYLIMGRGFTIMKMGWYASLPWIAGFFAQPLAGAEIYVGVFAVGGLGAVPQAGAAVCAFFAFEGGQAVVAQGDGLAGTHGDAGFLDAGDAELLVEKDDVIGKAGHGLHLAAHQKRVLVSDQQAAVEGNLRPAARGEQGIVEWAAIRKGYGSGIFQLEAIG